jgi:very-short-patch-repair endonuclease
MAGERYIDPLDEGQCSARDLEGAIARLARLQHGVVARRQLLAVGLTPKAIDSRVKRSRLHVVHRGVYAVGHDHLGRSGIWAAAVLAGGVGAALSHRSAAGLWGIAPDEAGATDVIAPCAHRGRGGIRFRRSVLPPDEVTVEDGIPVTIVPRTLFDLATVLRPRRLEHALNEAELRRLWDTLSLEHLLLRYPRRRGSRAIRALLAAGSAGTAVTRSELELRFLEFLDSARLPQPRTNRFIHGFEVDCVWPEHRLIVELDGYGTHSTRAAFERDRERGRVLQAAGWRCVRVTWRQLREAPGPLARDLRRLVVAGAAAA